MPAVQWTKAVPPGPGYLTNGTLTLKCAFKEAVSPKASKSSGKENNGFCTSAARRKGQGRMVFMVRNQNGGLLRTAVSIRQGSETGMHGHL